MKVLAVTNIYPTTRDPSQGAFVEQQVKGLRSVGVEVEVLHFDRRSEGASIYRTATCVVEDAAKSFMPDVVHVMYGGLLAYMATSAAVTVPFVVSFCGSDLLGDAPGGVKRRLAGALGIVCSHRAARRASAVIVKSESLKKAVTRSVNPDKVHLLPNGIDMERFKPLNRAACRASLGWRDDRFYVVFAGLQNNPVKRPELARSAVERLIRTGISAELRFLPGVPQFDVPIWLNAADVLLMTSAHEGSPNIVKEALSCNIPVVSVDVGDVAQRLQGVPGCYTCATSPEELSRALRNVHAGTRRVDGRNAVRAFSLDAVSNRIARIYDQIRSHPLPGEVDKHAFRKKVKEGTAPLIDRPPAAG